MKLLSSLAGGIAGACVVTLLHEVVKKIDKNAPRVDLLDKEVSNNWHDLDEGERKLFLEEIAGNLAANSVYFTIASLNDKHAATPDGAQGVMAELSSVYAPGLKNALNVKGEGSGDKMRALTVAYYFVGGWVAKKVMEMVEDKLG